MNRFQSFDDWDTERLLQERDLLYKRQSRLNTANKISEIILRRDNSVANRAKLCFGYACEAYYLANSLVYADSYPRNLSMYEEKIKIWNNEQRNPKSPVFMRFKPTAPHKPVFIDTGKLFNLSNSECIEKVLFLSDKSINLCDSIVLKINQDKEKLDNTENNLLLLAWSMLLLWTGPRFALGANWKFFNDTKKINSILEVIDVEPKYKFDLLTACGDILLIAAEDKKIPFSNLKPRKDVKIYEQAEYFYSKASELKKDRTVLYKILYCNLKTKNIENVEKILSGLTKYENNQYFDFSYASLMMKENHSDALRLITQSKNKSVHIPAILFATPMRTKIFNGRYLDFTFQILTLFNGLASGLTPELSMNIVESLLMFDEKVSKINSDQVDPEYFGLLSVSAQFSLMSAKKILSDFNKDLKDDGYYKRLKVIYNNLNNKYILDQDVFRVMNPELINQIRE